MTVTRRHTIPLLAALMLAAAMAVAGLTAVPAAQADPHGSISYVYSSSTRTFYGVPSGSGAPGTAYIYGYQGECFDGVKPGRIPNTDGGICMGKDYKCTGIYHGEWVWRRLPGEPWQRVGLQCFTDAQPTSIPLHVVETRLAQKLQAMLDPPTAKAQPSNGALVNLPAVFWANGPSAGPSGVVMLRPDPPLSGYVLAKPSYSWGFGDGSARQSGQGNAYDGTNPAVHPGHYEVVHTFDRAGTYDVTVRQHWEVRSSIPTLPGGTLTIDDPDVVSHVAVQVHRSDPVLVR